MSVNVRIRNGLCPDQTTGDGGATEGDIRGSFSDIIDVVGVKDLAGGHALVTQNSPAAMSVLVAPGVVYIPNADYNELDSNQVKFWEAVITVSTAVAITANTSGSTRIDLICVKMDTAVTPDEHASNIATLVAVAGTPGAGAPVTPDNYAKLAEIEVANGASTIVTADITDSRVQSTINNDYVGASVSVTTKGDLQTHNGTAPARLAVGSDGQNPRANSAATNGIDWADPLSSMARQAIINGNFDVWQRGVSVALADTVNTFLADRWQEYNGKDGGTLPTLTRSRQILTSGDIPNSFFYTRLTTNGAGSSLGVNSLGVLYQTIENGVRYLCGNGKKVTVSFWARSDIAGKRITPTIAQNYGAGGSPTATEEILGTPITLTSTWTKYTVTFTTNTLVGKTFGTNNNDYLVLNFWYMWGTTTGNSRVQASVTAETYVGTGNIDIAQVQLCAGDVALPFMPKSYEEELRACQRYCWVPDTSVVNRIGSGVAAATNLAVINIVSPVKMRKRPAITATATDWQVVDEVNANVDLSGISIYTTSSSFERFLMKCDVASGLTQYRYYSLVPDGAGRIIVFDAEL